MDSAIKEWADLLEEELVTFDNLGAAILGIGRTHTQPTRVVYSYEKIMNILVRHGMSYEEAQEFFDFNIEGVWAGENTPIILYDIDDNDNGP